MTATWILGVLTVLVAGWMIWRIIREPRNSRNGLLIIATLLLVWLTALASELQGYPEDRSPSLVIGSALLIGVLSIIAAGVYLLINGAVVIRREGFSVATLVTTVFGVGLLGTIASL